MLRKRRLLWAVPSILILAALFGVKWKRDHPTPAPHDLAVRESLLTAQWVDALCSTYVSTPDGPTSRSKSIDSFDQDLVRQISDCLFLAEHCNTIPDFPQFSISWMPKKRNLEYGVTDRIEIDFDHNEGVYVDCAKPGQTTFWKLHPASVKHIFNSLQNDPETANELSAAHLVKQ